MYTKAQFHNITSPSKMEEMWMHLCGLTVEPEPDRIWTLNRSHITESGLPDSVDPAQYSDINPDILL